jgi:hypothetical protein
MPHDVRNVPARRVLDDKKIGFAGRAVEEAETGVVRNDYGK